MGHSYNTILPLFLTFISFMVYAQKDTGTVIFKDGTKLEGIVMVKGYDKVIYKTDKKASKKTFQFDTIDTLKMNHRKGEKILVALKVKEHDKDQIVEVITTGENATLYKKSTLFFNPGTPMPYGTGGSVPSHSTIESAYLKKKNESEATYLGNNALFSKNFSKTSAEFFEDCPELVKKIENKEFKKKDLKEIIEFYNTNCN